MRRSALVALLAIIAILAACSNESSASQSADETESAATESPQASEGGEPSESAEASEPASGGGDSELLALLPDQVGGLDQTFESSQMNDLIAQSLAGSGVDASEVDYVIASWGTSSELALTAFRAPGIDATSLQMLAQVMSGAQTGGVEFEEATVGGKSVLSYTAPGTDGTVYLYLTDDTAFTVISQAPELADELLSQLP
jgi:hypothetical protein